MIYTDENWKPPVTYCEPNKVEVQRMNKQEAIEILKNERRVYIVDGRERKLDRALDMAIEALTVSDDCISRADLLEKMKSLCPDPDEDCGYCCKGCDIEDCIDIVYDAPPVEPPKKVVAQVKVDIEEVVKRIKEEYEIKDLPACEDTISRQAAVKYIDDYAHMFTTGNYFEGMMNAVDLLKQLDLFPPVEPERPRGTETMMVDGEPMEIDPLSYEVGYTHGQFSERPEGEWKDRIFDGCLERECDQCGEMIDAYIFRQNRYNYCPNCGADMKGDKK